MLKPFISKKASFSYYKENKISNEGYLYRFLFFGFFTHIHDFWSYLSSKPEMNTQRKALTFLHDSKIEFFFSKALALLIVILIFYKMVNRNNFTKFYLALLVPVSIQAYLVSGVYLLLIAIPIKLINEAWITVLTGYSVIGFYHLVFFIFYYRIIKKF